MKAILLIDHGSRRDAANEMMDCMANLVQAMAGAGVIVRYAHMELSEPSIAVGVRQCAEAGATEIIVFPYMLSPGRHSTGVIVRYAHMELSEPSIAVGVRQCAEACATEIIVFPYMLSPGKHSTGDIPRMVAEAASEFPGLDIRVTSAFGVHEKLAELILGRAGVPVVNAMTADEATRCWHSSQSTTACGDACRCRPVTDTVATADSAAH